jgi:hypothetical protein
MHSYCKQTLSQKINICIYKGAVLVDSYTSPYLISAISSCMSDVPSLSYGKLDLKLQMYLINQCLSPLTLWVWIPHWQGVLDTIVYDNVCQWHVAHCNWALIVIIDRNLLYLTFNCQNWSQQVAIDLKLSELISKCCNWPLMVRTYPQRVVIDH